jgi:hypothetical protein
LSHGLPIELHMSGMEAFNHHMIAAFKLELIIRIQ